MARFAIIRRIMIAAPKDAHKYVDICFKVINKINLSRHMKSELLEPCHWITHTIPRFNSNGPQPEINRQIVNESDFIIAFFKHEPGTPTGKYESGTVEEINLHMLDDKQGMVYFYRGDSTDQNKDEQQRLAEVKSWCFARGVMGEFNTIDELETSLSKHINLLLNKYPLLVNEKVKALANKEAQELERLTRDRKEFHFQKFKIEKGVELRYQTFTLKENIWWAREKDVLVDPKLPLQVTKIRDTLEGQIYNSFKFYLKIPNEEKVKKLYRTRLVNADAVVTGFGEVDPEDNAWWRIWFLHPDGFIHPYLATTYRANHSVIDLSGL